MSWPPPGPGPILRLSPSVPRRRRPGQACPDETYAEARRLVEGSSASLSDIARRLGIAVATVSKWALNGFWVRPPSSPPWSSRSETRGWGARWRRLGETRRGLRQAERLLGSLEAAPPPAPADAGPGLDRLAEALARLEEAARAHKERPRSGASSLD